MALRVFAYASNKRVHGVDAATSTINRITASLICIVKLLSLLYCLLRTNIVAECQKTHMEFEARTYKNTNHHSLRYEMINWSSQDQGFSMCFGLRHSRCVLKRLFIDFELISIYHRLYLL